MRFLMVLIVMAIAVFALMITGSFDSPLYKDSEYRVTTSKGKCIFDITSGELEGQVYKIRDVNKRGYNNYVARGELISEYVDRNILILDWSASHKTMKFTILTPHGQYLINKHFGANSGLYKAGLAVFDHAGVGPPK